MSPTKSSTTSVTLTAEVWPVGTQVFLIHATDALAVPVEAATVVGFTIDQNNDVTYSCRTRGAGIVGNLRLSDLELPETLVARLSPARWPECPEKMSHD